MGTHPIFESDFDCLTEINMGLFGASKADPKKQVNEMQSVLRKETRAIERQIRDIERQQEKTKNMLKQNAKKGDKAACRILAKEIVNSKKAVSRMYQSKAQLNSVMMNMKTQLATIRLTGAVEKSTTVMASMSKLIKLPELQKSMMNMSKEMTKMGIMDEMMEDAMSALDGDDIEDAVDSEVDKVLYELTAGQLGQMPDAQSDKLPQQQQTVPDVPEVESDDDLADRLAGLRS